MTEFDTQQIEKRLRERAEEIAARREGLKRGSANMLDSELADYDQHPADEGKYGICIDCGKEIPAARLEAIPESVRCVEDQARYEATLRASWTPPDSGVTP